MQTCSSKNPAEPEPEPEPVSRQFCLYLNCRNWH